MFSGDEERRTKEWRKETPFGMVHVASSGHNGGFRSSFHQEEIRKTGHKENLNGGEVNKLNKQAPFGIFHATGGHYGDFQDSKNDGNRCIHVHVACDRCGMSPIQGIRYRCSMCPDYDLCENCIVEHEEAGVENKSNHASFHDRSHLFIRVASPDKGFLSYPAIMNRTTTKHIGVTCSICHKQDPEGYLYKCQHCVGVNICESCEAKGLHDTGHPRLKLSLPTTESYLAQSRAEIKELKAQLTALEQKKNTTLANAGSWQFKEAIDKNKSEEDAIASEWANAKIQQDRPSTENDDEKIITMSKIDLEIMQNKIRHDILDDIKKDLQVPKENEELKKKKKKKGGGGRRNYNQNRDGNAWRYNLTNWQ